MLVSTLSHDLSVFVSRLSQDHESSMPVPKLLSNHDWSMHLSRLSHLTCQCLCLDCRMTMTRQCICVVVINTSLSRGHWWLVSWFQHARAGITPFVLRRNLANRCATLRLLEYYKSNWRSEVNDGVYLVHKRFLSWFPRYAHARPWAVDLWSFLSYRHLRFLDSVQTKASQLVNRGPYGGRWIN